MSNDIFPLIFQKTKFWMRANSIGCHREKKVAFRARRVREIGVSLCGRKKGRKVWGNTTGELEN